MEWTLGQFGDDRLEKGGSFSIGSLSAIAVPGQRQATWRHPRWRDPDLAVVAQSQGDGQMR